MRKIIILFFLLVVYFQLGAQNLYTIRGQVLDLHSGQSIPGAAVTIPGTTVGVFTDEWGQFKLCHLAKGSYRIATSYLGYKNDTLTVILDKDIALDLKLTKSSISLNEVVVSSRATKSVMNRRLDTFDKPVVSFSKLLSNTPEIATMNIGGSVAKPVIRGLSFNRVAVVNRGIVQQTQQWGADHGLEINLFDIEKAVVHKGASALLFGSNAVSSIEISPFAFRNADFMKGESQAWATSNNDELGGALSFEKQQGKWYSRLSYTYRDYADYRVPRDYFDYHGETHPIEEKRLANTAGKEQAFSGTLGYKNKGLVTYFNVSNNYQKNGFFAEAHSHAEHAHAESEEDHADDDHEGDAEHDHGSHRDIAMPYYTANHWALTNNTELKSSKWRMILNTGYQNNRRKEFSPFHPHYEGQPHPLSESDTEVDFNLNTYSFSARLFWGETTKWKRSVSANLEYQQNRIGGYEFFLPRYNQLLGGFSYINSYDVSPKLRIEGGLRYDIGHVDITGYYDRDMAAHLDDEGYDQSDIDVVAQRAYSVDRNFSGLSANIGLVYKPTEEWEWKVNLSKSFRVPSVNELGANGLHHAAFRYEIGNPQLNSEHGYTFELGMRYDDRSHIMFELSPFLNYYSNYVYMQKVDKLPVDLYDEDIFSYQQARVLFGGTEFRFVWHILKTLDFNSQGSWILNKEFNTNKPLAFTPPFNMSNEIKWFKFREDAKRVKYYQVSLRHSLFASQNRVAEGEMKTAGYNLLDFSTGFDYKLSEKILTRFNLQVQNIFNTSYMNHLSLYRRLNIPEPGRNIQLHVGLSF